LGPRQQVASPAQDARRHERAIALRAECKVDTAHSRKLSINQETASASRVEAAQERFRAFAAVDAKPGKLHRRFFQNFPHRLIALDHKDGTGGVRGGFEAPVLIPGT
jgi:hypothetical protein